MVEDHSAHAQKGITDNGEQSQLGSDDIGGGSRGRERPSWPGSVVAWTLARRWHCGDALPPAVAHCTHPPGIGGVV